MRGSFSRSTLLLTATAVVVTLQQTSASYAATEGAQVSERSSATPPQKQSSLHQASFTGHVAAAGGVFVEKVTSLFDSIVPDTVENESIFDGDGGLYGDEGSPLAWGGSTLEVVKTQASYLTRPAAFGPRIIDDNGLRGKVLPISDFYRGSTSKIEALYNHTASLTANNFGCPYRGGPGWHEDEDQDSSRDRYPGERFDVASTLTKDKPPRDWIALIERGGECSFVAKVRVAQALGAQAVVVGDAPSPSHDDRGRDLGLSGRLVTMFAPGDTSDVMVPSTFVTRPSYVDLVRLVDEAVEEAHEDCVVRKKEGKECSSDDRGVEVILWRDDAMWEWPLIDLAFVLLMLPSFMTLITIIVHRIRLIHQRRKDRAPEVAVLNLPCLIWRGNGQPWEKVEDATVVGDSGKGEVPEDQRRGWHHYRHRVEKWFGHLKRRNSMDMESGAAENGEGAVRLSSADIVSASENDAGPSTSTTPAVQLKTVPIAPPVPPSDRTYFSFDECAICLSDFVDGDMVRVLPCGHVFHLPEIDSWLLKVKKFCPICKRDMTSNTTATTSSTSTSAAAEGGPTSTTPAANTATSSDEQTPLLIEHDVD